MPCEEYLELISAAVDGALSREEEARLTAHLVDCPACRELLSDLQEIHAQLSTLPAVEAPEGLSERIMAAVEADNVTPLPVKRSAFWWKRWASVAAVLALAVVGAWQMDFFPTMGKSGNALPADAGVQAAPEAVAAESSPLNDGSDEEKAAVSGRPSAGGDESQSVSSAPQFAPTPVPTAVYKVMDSPVPLATQPAGDYTSAPEEENGITAFSAENGQMPMVMMRSAPPPAEEITAPEEAPEGVDASSGDTPTPSLFLFTNSPASGEPEVVDETSGEPVEPSASETQGLTPGQALDAVMEACYVPEDAVLVDTEDFLGWKTPYHGVGEDPEAPEVQQASIQLQYLGLSGNGKYHEFCLFDSFIDAPGEEERRSVKNHYAVPLDGGEVLVRQRTELDSADVAWDADQAELEAYDRALQE